MMNTIYKQSPLLPICAENALQFSNDVYNKRYTREKIASRFKQSGRSMIEMLGVLAIVGVLSVGGIAGYSKAMQKYRTNKTIEQVTQIINGVRTLYSQQKNYEGITAQGPNNPLKKAKILPESAWECTNCDPKNPFGGSYRLFPNGRKTGGDNKAVWLNLTDIPDDACIELITQDWGAGEGLFAVGMDSDTTTLENCSGEDDDSAVLTGCAGGSTVPLPIPMDKAVDHCGNHDFRGSDNHYIHFYFY